jgi:hypothetical protein
MGPLLVFADKICVRCGCKFNRNRLPSGRLEGTLDFAKRKCCSQNCSSMWHKGTNHHNWKGGIRHRPDGYIRITGSDKYLHRQIMEQILGRRLLPNENVHHLNGDNTDNRPDNLTILSNSEHRKLHCETQAKDELSGRFVKIG